MEILLAILAGGVTFPALLMLASQMGALWGAVLFAGTLMLLIVADLVEDLL